jgi:transcriptional regulator with XRE-family HTH domain
MEHKNDFKILGSNLEYYRTKADLTIKQVAEYLEVPEDVYLEYENERDSISLMVLQKLEDLLNVEMYDILKVDVIKHEHEFQRVSLKGRCKKDLQSISSFYKIIRNYIKLKTLKDETNN